MECSAAIPSPVEATTSATRPSPASTVHRAHEQQSFSIAASARSSSSTPGAGRYEMRRPRSVSTRSSSASATSCCQRGAVARLSGRPASSVRYYEKIGLLPAPARASGRRVYDAAILRTLSVIDTAQRPGFTLDEAKALLGGRPLRALAREKLPAVEAIVEEAERRRAWLLHASRCECVELDECALFP